MIATGNHDDFDSLRGAPPQGKVFSRAFRLTNTNLPSCCLNPIAQIGVCRFILGTLGNHCRGGIHASRQYNVPFFLNVSAKTYRVCGRHECLPYSKNVTYSEISKHQFVSLLWIASLIRQAYQTRLGWDWTMVVLSSSLSWVMKLCRWTSAWRPLKSALN